jgi:hypothetical protein
MKHATVVVLGADCPELPPVAKAAAKRAAARVVVEPSVDNLLSWMGEDRPVAVLTTMGVASQADVLALRTRASMAAVPVIGVTDQVTDLSFEDAFSNGYDDVCAADPRRLTTRLRQLVERGPVDVQPTERRVVLAGERKNRLMTGRVFRNADSRSSSPTRPRRPTNGPSSLARTWLWWPPRSTAAAASRSAPRPGAKGTRCLGS